MLILFKYIDKKIYNIQSVKTVTAKTDYSSQNKQQATLVLYIFTDKVLQI